MKIKISRDDWSIDAVKRRKSRINPQPQYQRTPVWNEKKDQLLIDSILRGYDLPKFYLRVSVEPYEHEVVDGQQRLRAIWRFLDDKYALGEKSIDIPDFDNLTSKKWSELTSIQQDRIGKFELSVVIIEEASDLEIRQLFLRLQEGVSLIPTEKRNAMPGNMRDFVANLGDTHPVFSSTSLPGKGKRYEWHELVAIVTCLEKENGPTDVKAPSLKAMYENSRNFEINGSVARTVKRNLNYMKTVLQNNPPEMDIKWGFVDLYLLISVMNDLYVIRGREEDFLNFYREFESARREVLPNHGELLASNKSTWDRDLYDYIEAFIRSGGTKPNIEKRHQVYRRRFIKDTHNLIPKDPQRSFTHDERIVIWHRDKDTCQQCQRKISFEEMQADHIVPHSRGGETTLDNAQALCQQCNAKKGTA